MTARLRFALAAVLACFFASGARAAAEPFAAGDLLRITFNLNPQPGWPADVYNLGSNSYFEFATFLQSPVGVETFTALPLFTAPRMNSASAGR